MKLKVGVLFGGKSGEHDVSLMSASNVIEVMDKEKYDIIKIGITKLGKWMIYTGDTQNIADGSWENDRECTIKEFSIFDHPMINEIDVFFPILHGPNGEDGTVQGLLKIMNKPFVGCGVLASSVGMDKVYSKILFENAGIPIGTYMSLYKSEWVLKSSKIISSIEEKLAYPFFIKPANMGSSVGISKAHNRDEMLEGFMEAFKYDSKLILEKAIDCREVECAVLGNKEPRASVLGEILPSQEFYDYKAKYTDGDKSTLIIPAQLDEKTTEKIKDYAVRAFKSINGRGLSRVDFFIDKNTGEIMINEINTLPGFTNISMYPKLWEETGISYSDLVEEIIRLAIEEYNS
ncbi:D-alanine--D-alanine ligase [Alkalibaculum sp. M08DMB]|uniref:D-alanine--D-alanine ligase n=1 Tax=Alkalibaculum sporogenes TaxID=2655001 RepID=A0A6A7KCX8_9FIRM|nr:D-alanine--D-alanine ligase family protein [Alkalibaculum sporogenes]MPW27205.1 D-alanine--D-alanine ligase [Alkalibaculum sporogenes]